MINSQLVVTILFFIGAVALLVFVIQITLLGIAIGQDVDPRYVCLYEFQFPYAQQCFDLRVQELIEKLYERALFYNNTN